MKRFIQSFFVFITVFSSLASAALINVQVNNLGTIDCSNPSSKEFVLNGSLSATNPTFGFKCSGLGSDILPIRVTSPAGFPLFAGIFSDFPPSGIAIVSPTSGNFSIPAGTELTLPMGNYPGFTQFPAFFVGLGSSQAASNGLYPDGLDLIQFLSGPNLYDPSNAGSGGTIGSGSGSGTVDVPEPVSAALFAIGLLVMAYRARAGVSRKKPA